MTTPIRGREHELKVVRERIGELMEGRGTVVVIEGPPGIGKTRLLREFVAAAEKAGVRTLFGQGFEYQQAVALAPLFMATLRAQPPIGDATALRRLDQADLHYWVVHDLQTAIGEAASHTRLLVVLDDIHWADHGTLVAMRTLTTSLADAPVLWVLATRTGAGEPAVAKTVSALEEQGAHLVTLGAVTPTAVADIVENVVRARADASLLILANKAQGNPFLLMELIQGLQEENRISVVDGHAVAVGEKLPRRLTAAMGQRLDRLSADARRVVQVASVLPDRFSAGQLAAMLERRPIGLISAVEEAVGTDLLVEDGDRLRFDHDLLRQATRQSLPQSLRQAMERDAATVLLEGGAAPADVATQLARSAEIGDQAAISTLRQAAQSLASSDPCTAADLSMRALQLLPRQDPMRAGLVAETVMRLDQAMRYDEAQQLTAATLSTDLSPQEEAEVRLGSSTMSMRLPGRRAEENRRALQLTGISDDIRTRHRGWLAYNLMMDGQSLVRQAANDALTAATSTDDPVTRLLGEVALANIDCADGYGHRAMVSLQGIAALIRSGTPNAVHQVAVVNRANLLVTLGLLDEAETAVADGLRTARTEHNRITVQLLAEVQALTHLAAGRLSAARAAVERLSLEQRMTWTRIEGQIGMLTLAYVAAHTDDRSLLGEVAKHARDACGAGGPAVRREGLAALAHAAWQRGDVHEALRLLADDFTLLHTPMWVVDLDHIILAARVAATAADAGLCARVRHAAQLLTREEPGMPLFTAVGQHARAILDRDPDALLAAADSLSSSPRPLLHAAAAEDAGRELTRTNRHDEAIDLLNVAFDTYTNCEAIADAHRVGQLLREHGVTRRVSGRPRPRTGLDSLTDSELTVAHLVAAGPTNRAVAQQLCLSPHTVNTHLRNVFAKLGIKSRIELSRLINGQD